MTFPTFEEFHRLCTGHDPHDWQCQLTDAALTGDWPDLINVPTGLGKTGSLLAAIYAVAYQSHSGGVRTAPQRIVHVVDRRTVVDQTLSGLQRAITEIAKMAPVQGALRRLAGDWAPEDSRNAKDDNVGEPIVQAIHGEALDSGSWLRPTGCTVLTMTPHQLVSRLLFRGYGVSRRTRSIHAGLLGVDSLLIVDEPHLSHQAIATLRSILDMQGSAPESLGVPRTRMVLLGATVPAELFPAEAKRLDWGDGGAKESAEMTRRLDAERPLVLKAVTGADDKVAKALVGLATEQRGKHRSARRIGIMVNTVPLAQAVFEGVKRLDREAILVTSRMRPLDRSPAGKLATASIVVATQCLEVGVDVSFDALLTEACPYPSLVQRLGRLNRDGNADHPEAVMVVPKKVSPGTKAVYGQGPVDATIALLSSWENHGVINMSLRAGLGRSITPDVWAAPPRCATFHEGYLATMATTYPACQSDLPVEAFVMGPEDVEETDVLVCWRDNPSADLLAQAPPLAAEMVSVPLPALKRFLAPAANQKTVVVVADLDHPGVGAVEARDGLGVHAMIRGASWDEMWEQINSTRMIRPGAVVVLRSDAGGYRTDLGWDPTADKRVPDLSLAAALASRDIGRRGFKVAPLTDSTIRAVAAVGDALLPAEQVDGLQAMLEEYASEAFDDLDPVLDRLSELGLGDWQVRASLDSPQLLAYVPTTVETKARPKAVRQTLESHQQQAENVASAVCRVVGLSPETADAVTTAARLHDRGKEDCAFQRYLGNFDPDEQPWAKSRRGQTNLAADRKAALLAGLKLGWRHEGLSAEKAVADGHGPLTTHLIATHHGRGRPLIAGTGQAEPQGQMTALGDLGERFGPWGLAYLEAVVRLSDWLVSAHPEPDCAVREPPRGRHVSVRGAAPKGEPVELAGLLATPATGWFAAAGLLRVAHDHGVVGTTLHWTKDGMPMWRSAVSLEEAGHWLLASEQWHLLEKAGCALEGGIGIKHQKVSPVQRLPELLREAISIGGWLVTGLVHDAGRASGVRIPLALPAFANNSSFVGEALRMAKELQSHDLAAAFTDVDSGWGEAQCDGGFDRGPVDGGVTGREQFGNRTVRLGLAPAALMGMAAFGASNIHGFGTDSRGTKLELPTPAEPMTWPEFSAWARLAGQGPAQRYTAVSPSKGMRAWRSE